MSTQSTTGFAGIDLAAVAKPYRYLGGEHNAVYKDPAAVRVRWAMAFPDLYEVGMSHLGMQILYHHLNAREDVWAERVFAPWRDMAEAMRAAGRPLRTLESGTPIRDLDVLGFSLLYEMSYTNVLYMLDLAGMPLWSRERDDARWPLVVCGGPVVFNPEPIADFVDACLLGDGEVAALEIAEVVADWKRARASKHELLKALLKVEGIYVPSFYDVRYHSDGTVAAIEPRHGAPEIVEKAVVPDLNAVSYPTAPVVPAGRTVHDRVSVEIARGCMQGCRFCQAGYIYRPSRERNPDKVVALAAESLRNTGYEDLSVLSLSAGDHTQIETIVANLMRKCEPSQISLSVPSMRVGTLSRDMMEEIRRVRKTSFTMAPEAGSQRMRGLINKVATPERLAANARDAFSLGWSAMKLYFMIGLPTETDEDLDGIVETGALVRRVGREFTSNPDVKVSVSTFVPKPHTPFQWAPQISVAETIRRQRYLRDRCRDARVRFKHHDARTSYLEGIFARGDRRLGALLYEAHRRGANFDGWPEYVRWDVWRESWEAAGVDPDGYVLRERAADEVLPWDHLSSRVTKEWLWEDWKDALDLARVEDCRFGPCYRCGVCDFREIENLNADANLPVVRAPEIEHAPPDGARDLWRYEIEFEKVGTARYLGHLEMADQFMRAFARAELPIAKTLGYHPHPKMSFAGALALGIESLSEALEIWTTEPVDPEVLARRLGPQLPQGLVVRRCRPVDLGEAPLTQRLYGVRYEVRLPAEPAADPAGVRSRIEAFLACKETWIQVEKKGKMRDVEIRGLVRRIEVTAPDRFDLYLAVHQAGGVKPRVLVAHILGAGDDVAIELRKLEQYFHQHLPKHSVEVADSAAAGA